MNIRQSVLLSASCILVFSRIALASDVIECKLPQRFSTKISEDRYVHFYETDLNVRLYYDKMSLTSYKGTNTVGIQSNFVGISFNGFMNSGNHDGTKNMSTQPEVLSLKFVDRISGIAQRVSNSSILDSCRVVLLPTEMDRPEVTGRIANEIRRLAESCIEVDVCSKIGEMKHQYMTNPPEDDASDLLFGCPDPIVIVTNGCEEIYNTDSLQPMINKFVDIGLERVTKIVGATSGGVLAMPDIEKNFTTGSSIFTTNGYFRALGGTFRDLTTFRRISDVSLSHNGPRFSAAVEFGLDVADINFPLYEVGFGIMGTNGRISGTVNNTRVVTRVSADYTRKPCRMTMDYIRMTELGEVRIEFTGLGPMNWMAEKLVNWVTAKFRESITIVLQKQIMMHAEEQLSKFDCETFRP